MDKSSNGELKQGIGAAGGAEEQKIVAKENPTQATGHPRAFLFFFWGEFAERCCYYGSRAILAKYLTDQLDLSESLSSMFLSSFFAACYFLPLLGGYLADRFFGKYWTIVGFSIPYVVGQLMLGIENTTVVAISLGLLAMGSGVIKPNISTLMGITYDQKRPGQTQLRSQAFAWFYFAINVGAMISQFAVPRVRTNFSYQIAFLVPAVLMVIALTLFALGKKHYGIDHPGKSKALTPEESKQRYAILGKIILLFFPVMFFWAVFDQSSITWIYFTDSHIRLELLGWEMSADGFQFINALFIIIMLPIMTYLLTKLHNMGFIIRPTTKMIFGFVATTLSMVALAIPGFIVGPGTPVYQIKASVNGSPMSLLSSPDKIEFISNDPQKQPNDSSQSKNKDQDKSKEQESANEIGKFALNPADLDDMKSFRNGTLKFNDGSSVQFIKGQMVMEHLSKLNDPKKMALLGILAKDLPSEKELAEPKGLTAKELNMLKVKVSWKRYVPENQKANSFWIVLAYFILTIAEILISVTGLELAFVIAPDSMKGFVTACWLATVGFANLLINAPVTQLYSKLEPGVYFSGLALMVAVITIVFYFVGKNFNKKNENDENKGSLSETLPIEESKRADAIEGMDESR